MPYKIINGKYVKLSKDSIKNKSLADFGGEDEKGKKENNA